MTRERSKFNDLETLQVQCVLHKCTHYHILMMCKHLAILQLRICENHSKKLPRGPELFRLGARQLFRFQKICTSASKVPAACAVAHINKSCICVMCAYIYIYIYTYIYIYIHTHMPHTHTLTKSSFLCLQPRQAAVDAPSKRDSGLEGKKNTKKQGLPVTPGHGLCMPSRDTCIDLDI